MLTRGRFRFPLYIFRLYVAGDASNAVHAVANLNALCRTHLAHRHEIEVVDVFRDPDRALADGVVMTPTLVKLAPLPVSRIVGKLGQTQPVLQALGLEAFSGTHARKSSLAEKRGGAARSTVAPELRESSYVVLDLRAGPSVAGARSPGFRRWASVDMKFSC